MNNKLLKFYAVVMTIVSLFLAFVALHNSQPVNCDKVQYDELTKAQECILELNKEVQSNMEEPVLEPQADRVIGDHGIVQQTAPVSQLEPKMTQTTVQSGSSDVQTGPEPVQASKPRFNNDVPRPTESSQTEVHQEE